MASLSALRRKFRGALLGVAVGDALGAPFEGRQTVTREQIDLLLNDRRPLRYTDDTHMTIALAEAIIERHGVDGPHVATTFARAYASEPWRRYGAGPPEVFRMLASGVPWDQAGQRLYSGTGSYGNGAAMRVAPVALFCVHTPNVLPELARTSAIVTHTHPLGIAGALLQAEAIALLLRHAFDTPFDPQAFLALLQGRVQEPDYVTRLERVGQSLDDPTEEHVVRAIGNGIAASEAVPAALWAFLRTPDSLPEAVIQALLLGGDTDTIASMTGALAGALHGEDAIPAAWRERVEDEGRIRSLADELWRLATQR